MIILTIRTDKPEAEVGLYDNNTQLAYETWYAHRELSVTIHQKISEVLDGQQKRLTDVQAILCFAGPGSFTGLRIGLTVANALAYSLSVPVIAQKDDDWLQAGLTRLMKGEQDALALPEYGAPARITVQKK